MVCVTLLLETKRVDALPITWSCGFATSRQLLCGFATSRAESLWLSVRYLEKCEASPRAA
jgi:hypothetical protein